MSGILIIAEAGINHNGSFKLAKKLIDTAKICGADIVKFQSFKSVLEATRAQLKAAEIANEGITLEYDSGNTRTTLELIQSRSLLLEARIAFARAERDFIVSQFDLSKRLGSLSINSIK